MFPAHEMAKKFTRMTSPRASTWSGADACVRGILEKGADKAHREVTWGGGGDANGFAGKLDGVPGGLPGRLFAVGTAELRETSLGSMMLPMDLLSMLNLPLGHPQNLSEDTCIGWC